MLSHSLLLHAAYIQQVGQTSILTPNIVLLVVVLLYLWCGSTKEGAVGHPRAVGLHSHAMQLTQESNNTCDDAACRRSHPAPGTRTYIGTVGDGASLALLSKMSVIRDQAAMK